MGEHIPRRDLPTTRRAAIEAGETRFFTGRPCSHGHISERLVANKRCVACVREYQNKRSATPEFKLRRKAYDRSRWENDRYYMVEKNRRYYAENAEKVNTQKREYWEKNSEKLKLSSREWRAKNKDAVRELNARRRKQILRATPAWADMMAIRAVYGEAVRLTEETGIEHHVDHIVPLRGKSVCGLHVHWNLQPLAAVENLKKHNFMPHESVVIGFCRHGSESNTPPF